MQRWPPLIIGAKYNKYTFNLDKRVSDNLEYRRFNQPHCEVFTLLTIVAIPHPGIPYISPHFSGLGGACPHWH